MWSWLTGVMKLLLDTCSLIWMTSAPDHLGPVAAQMLDSAHNQLTVSDSSVWEICLKWQSGKLQLPQPPRLWLQEQRDLWRFDWLSIERKHLWRVSELPMHHRDPFDRLLVAQAIEDGLTLVTPDPDVKKYPVATVW